MVHAAATAVDAAAAASVAAAATIENVRAMARVVDGVRVAATVVGYRNAPAAMEEAGVSTTGRVAGRRSRERWGAGQRVAPGWSPAPLLVTNKYRVR